MNKIIYDFGIENNILIGVCDAKPLNSFKEKNLNKETPFVTTELEKRIYPKASLEKAKSIIIVGVPYGTKFNFSMDNEIRGKISVSAIGTDYHIKVKEILESLITKLKTKFDFEYKIFVDTGFLPEKELAVKSGIGFIGKNSLVISEKYGSFIFLGHALLSIELETNKTFEVNKCGSCKICEMNCPTNAINSDFTINPFKCISYLTQKKGDLPEYLKEKMGNAIYGCDICQVVCPFNKDKEIQTIKDINEVMPKVSDFLSLSNKDFKNKYYSTAIFWRGKKTLFRNAEIANNNFSKTKDEN